MYLIQSVRKGHEMYTYKSEIEFQLWDRENLKFIF